MQTLMTYSGGAVDGKAMEEETEPGDTSHSMD